MLPLPRARDMMMNKTEVIYVLMDYKVSYVKDKLENNCTNNYSL